ncbi:MAG: methyltransferase domain-containing protein [Myxococcota bacterium]
MRQTIAVLLLAGVLAGCNGVSKFDFTTLGRATWQRPEDIVRALALAPGDRVADLGAGEGYFLPYLAQAVGSDGRVYAVEVDSELVGKLEERFREDGATIEVVLGQTDDPELPDGGIDLVLIVNTYHHIEDRPGYFAKLRGDLSPTGRVAIIEPNADLTGLMGLLSEEGHESSGAEIVEEMREAGYRPAESFDFLPVQVFEVFAPEGALAATP